MSGATVMLPACTESNTTSVNVPAGCAPTVDGTYHAGEWSDATCVSVGADPVYLKYAGDTVYIAWSMTPTCGCAAALAFNTDGSQTLDGSQFALSLLDDPFGAAGDAAEFVSTNGGWPGTPGVVANGIVIANPPNQPSPVTYEIAIPFSLLGITAGQGKTIGLAISHSLSGTWPSSLNVGTSSLPGTLSTWGTATSAGDWH
jgi:hypothetical protein